MFASIDEPNSQVKSIPNSSEENISVILVIMNKEQ